MRSIAPGRRMSSISVGGVSLPSSSMMRTIHAGSRALGTVAWSSKPADLRLNALGRRLLRRHRTLTVWIGAEIDSLRTVLRLR